MFRILVVEDDKNTRKLMEAVLSQNGYEPVPACDGVEALDILDKKHIDLILLDIMMPGLDGFGVCRALRRSSSVPIIFLTALSDEDDKLRGYELGADDYVTKPFTMSVLYAKTMALIKRSRGDMRSSDNRIEVAGITVDTTAHKVYLGRKEVILTPKEYSLLLCLMRNKNMVLSREQLLVKCWGYDYEGESRAVDTHIKRLREKLGDHAGCIKTVVKAGYVLEG